MRPHANLDRVANSQVDAGDAGVGTAAQPCPERGKMSGRRKSERGLILVEVSLNKGCGEQKSEVKLDITSFVCFVLLCIYWGVFLKNNYQPFLVLQGQIYFAF